MGHPVSSRYIRVEPSSSNSTASLLFITDLFLIKLKLVLKFLDILKLLRSFVLRKLRIIPQMVGNYINDYFNFDLYQLLLNSMDK